MALYTKLRNLFSILRFESRFHRLRTLSFIINIGILLYAFITFPDINSTSIQTLAIVFFINILWQCYAVVADVHKLLHNPGFKIKSNLPDDFASAFSITTEVQQRYPQSIIDQKQNIYAIYSDLCNYFLRSDTPIYAEISSTALNRTPLVEYISKYYDMLIQFLQAKRHSDRDLSFFDESKLCLLTDITPNHRLIVRKGYYYYSFITNDIYCNLLKDNDGQLSIYPPFNWQTYAIDSIGSRRNVMSNHIGISTIAISNDNYILILRHNSRAAIHIDRYQPSGSGSANYSDLRYCRCKQGYDFRKFIIRSAERELFEETHFNEKNYNDYKERYIKKTVITGFFRDIIRGGKPDFCCITWLNIDKNKALDLFSSDTNENDDTIVPISIGNNLDFNEADSSISSIPMSPGLVLSYKFMKEYLSGRQ